MAKTFKECMEEDVATLFNVDEFAIPVKIDPNNGGATIDTTAIIEENAFGSSGAFGPNAADVKIIHLPSSAVPVIEPGYLICTETETYRVTRKLSRDSMTIKVEAVENVRMSPR